MIRLASRSSTNGVNRSWDIGVPQTGGNTAGIGYSFVIHDATGGGDPEFIIKYGTGNVGIGRTNPASALDVNGTVTATTFVGNASGLTNLDAADLTGTIALARLPSAVVTNNATAVTLAGSFSGNGGGLTNLYASNLTGTVADARLSANVALLNANQSFTASNRFAGVVALTNTANTLAGTFSGNGAGLTSLNASQLAAGTVPVALLPGAVVTNNATAVTLGGTFSGSGGGLTNLDATDLTGTIADARLSANVALLNTDQVFTGSNRFAGVVTLTNTANTLAGTFSGNGAGLTNLTGSANYVFSYCTNSQTVLAAGTFQDITNYTDARISGWSHSASTASFTNSAGGLYLIHYDAEASFTIVNISGSVSLRAVSNGTEIPGSQVATFGHSSALGSQDVVLPVSKSFIASLSAGDVLKFQFTGTTGTGVAANNGSGTVRPAFSFTITRLQ